VVLVHGRGADEWDLLDLVEALPEPCLYVSVRAPHPWTWGGYTWFGHRPDGTPDPQGFAQARDALGRFLRGLPEAVPVDPERLAVVGFSQGAALAAAVLLLPESGLRVAAALSGFPDPNPGPGGPGRRAFVAHGTEDPVVPPLAGRRVRDQLAARGVDVAYREYRVGHAVSPEELVDLAAWLREALALPAADG